MHASNDTGGARLLYCPCPDRDTALRLAGELVEQRLAACGNVLPGVTSVFRYAGAVQHEEEVVLIAKTTAALATRCATALAAAHPYDCPVVLTLAPDAINAPALAWLQAECTGSA
ncbi:MAG: divalent-cation tolerance protein CutA [Planctomycetota bacterium]